MKPAPMQDHHRGAGVVSPGINTQKFTVTGVEPMRISIQNNVDDFVRHYWQKQPCLLRGVLPGFESPVTPEELAGLACEEGVHCRLVIEDGDEKPWQLRYGPFEERDFVELPESHYSLLVSECEKWLPELGDLARRDGG